MTFQHPLSTSPPLTTKIQTNLSRNNRCEVCGDKATIYNYGALSCFSCKTFFRRHGFRPKNIGPCNFDGNCEITILSRKDCTVCRLAKCLTVGMNSNLIRKEIFNNKRSTQKQLIISKSFSSSRLVPLNLLINDQSSLTLSEWTLLSNVVHAFDRFTPITKARLMIEHLNTQSSLEQGLNLMSIIYSSLESFVSSTADFRIMTNAEQQSLIERNMHGLWSLHACLTFRESGVFDNRINEEVIVPLYGIDNVKHTKRITTQLDNDLTFIKLMLMTLTFSSNLFTVNEKKNFHRDSLLYGTFRLFGSQNVYVELMWNYMMYRYGFIQTIKRFAAFIRIILNMIQLASNINESNEIHHQLADEIIEQTEHSLSLSVHVNVPLWGKT